MYISFIHMKNDAQLYMVINEQCQEKIAHYTNKGSYSALTTNSTL